MLSFPSCASLIRAYFGVPCIGLVQGSFHRQKSTSCVLSACTSCADSLSQGAGSPCATSWADADLNARGNPHGFWFQKKRKLLSMCTEKVCSEGIFSACKNGRIPRKHGTGNQQREARASRSVTRTFHASSLHPG